jgi:alpha-1,3-glucosyltransferase
MRVVRIGSVVIATFLVVWLPFIVYGKEVVLEVIQRLFPLNRKLFEDKVANFWCSISPLIKFKELFPDSTMAMIWFASNCYQTKFHL